MRLCNGHTLKSNSHCEMKHRVTKMNSCKADVAGGKYCRVTPEEHIPYAAWNVENLDIPLSGGRGRLSTFILQLNLWETRVWPSLPKSCLSLQLMPTAVCACLDTYQHLSFLSTHPRPPKDAEMSLLRLGRYCPLPEALLKWIDTWALHVFPGSSWRWGQGRTLVAAPLFLRV